MGIFLKDINLKGKTALITGATKGLGRGAAIAIAEAGGNIIAVGRNQIELNTLKKEIKFLPVHNSLKLSFGKMSMQFNYTYIKIWFANYSSTC